MDHRSRHRGCHAVHPASLIGPAFLGYPVPMHYPPLTETRLTALLKLAETGRRGDGSRSSWRREIPAAFQELLKGDGANLDLVASVLKEIHKAAEPPPRPSGWKASYDSATKPPRQSEESERRRKDVVSKPGSRKPDLRSPHES